jgi:16S rRNA C967 or C1407 C5-methylase (RsmB/RsmF family)
MQINPLENEGNVAWALTRFPELRLRELGIPSQHAPRGLAIAGLREEDAEKVARYEGLATDADVFTGFFIACFIKDDAAPA